MVNISVEYFKNFIQITDELFTQYTGHKSSV